MGKKETRDRIEKLKKIINEARYSYHILDKSIMSDAALDSLKHELLKLEERYPGLRTPDSPTQRIGGRPLEGFRKVQHIVPQWSFNDAFNTKEIVDFDERMKRELRTSNVEYTAELKIDGMHVISTYKKGILKVGSTRGDGKIGEDVTQNLKTIESVPLRLQEDVDAVVEGEVFMRKSVFKMLNKERRRKKENPFANPRNAAAGGIRQLDPNIARGRQLDMFFYDFSWPEQYVPKTQVEELKRLMELGFKVNKNFKYCKNINEVIDFWRGWSKKREEEDYWIDGIAVKVNKREHQNQLGYTGKAPRWAVAFKWPGEEATTILKNVVFQVGRTGKITPVAILKPVNIKGTIVTRATLHNIDEIKRLGAKIGDTVILEKAGDVIPHITKVIPALRSKDAKTVIFPKDCPVCNSKVTRPEGEVAHYCSNSHCGAQHKSRLYYFISKKAFNVEGLGPKIIDRLMDEGLISRASDLFLLKRGDIEPLERFAEKSAVNLVDAIQKSKEIILPRFLIASQIKYIGEETAQLLTENFGAKIHNIPELIQLFQNLPQEEIEKIEGIGPNVGESIKKWFSNSENIDFLKRLEKVGIKITKEREKITSEKLKGKLFVFTGELSSMSREEAEEKVKNLGGKITGSVSKNTSFVIAGKNPGSKIEKAKKVEVTIIKEDDFLKMIK